MIDTVLNLLFRCSHRRLTRPMTPVSKAGVPHGDPYVVCLDCGKQFPYDVREMRIGKAIERSHNAHILPPKQPMPRKKKVAYALLASVPVAVLLGSALRSKKSQRTSKPGTPGGDAGSVDQGAGI